MKSVLSLGLLFFAITVHAVVPDMKFRRLDTRDGLSNTQTNCIFRDSRGLVWIGTPYGLNRYDGYRIRCYYSQAKDTTTLFKSYVDEVQEDAEGSLWLRHGVQYSIFDPVAETCNRHAEQWLHERGVQGSVERLYIDKHKNFWVKTYDHGFWHLNAQTGKVHHFASGTGAQTISSDFAVSDFEEHGNSLLVISNNGKMVCFHTSDVRISWKSNRLQRCGAPKNAGYVLHVDNWQNIWALADSRAFVFLRKTGRWYSSANDALQQLGIAALRPDMMLWDVVSDSHGMLWLATDHDGLCVVDMQGRQVRQFLTEKYDETTIGDNTLRKIYRDQQDRMWIATYMNGVNFYTENQFDFKHVDLGNVNTVCIDSSGDCWAGTNDQGIVHYSLLTGKRTIYNKKNSGLESDIIVSSLSAKDGTLWFGTYEGGLASIKEGHVQTFKMHDGSDGLANNSVWAIDEDSVGNIWIGTLGGGLQRIDRHTGKFTTLNMENSALPSNYISSVQLTPDGLLLVGHSEFYSLVNPRSMTVENCGIAGQQTDIPTTPASIQVFQDSRGLIWQGAASGATVSDPSTGTTYLLDMNSGLIGSTVNGMVEDRHHGMWVVTEHGVSNVIPQREKNNRWAFLVRSYNNRDGLQNAVYNQRSVVIAPDGRIVIGGHEGIDVINPLVLTAARPLKEIPQFSGVKVLDEKVRNVGERLELDYSENMFTIQLCSNSGEVHNRARFAYRLEGFSDQWRYTEDARPDVTYTGLPSGSYVLCVRMLENDGIMGVTEARLPITIATPWYRSWWMWLVYLMILGAAAYWQYRRSQEKLRLEKLKMERESSHRVDELKQKFEETINDELHQPFRQTFESLNAMMQQETDEQRYEQQQQVFSQVENLLEEVSKLTENNQLKTKLKPRIREQEIESLDEKLVRAATDYVEKNLDNADISVETMAEELGMSRVHLYKKLTAITDLTPSEFIRQIRLRHAEQLLSKSQLTVAEVAYKVGFNNPRYLSKYFKEMYGVMPSEYKNRNKNEMSGD